MSKRDPSSKTKSQHVGPGVDATTSKAQLELMGMLVSGCPEGGQQQEVDYNPFLIQNAATERHQIAGSGV